ncbi:hypothetical protein NIES298_18210, partial [Microcystis aeruginosa NIES-298]
GGETVVLSLVCITCELGKKGGGVWGVGCGVGGVGCGVWGVGCGVWGSGKNK